MSHFDDSDNDLKNLLRTISHGQSLAVLALIVNTKGKIESKHIRSHLKIGKDQYYEALKNIIGLGLIKKNRLEYTPTSLGKIVYYSQYILENGLAYHTKLRAIDNFDEPYNQDIKKRITFELIDNNNIRQILLREEHSAFNLYRNPTRQPPFVEESNDGIQREKPSQQNIIVIEDDLDVLYTFNTLLDESGYNTYAFSDSGEALKAFSLNPRFFDLVITDIRMGGSCGLEVYRTLKSMSHTKHFICIGS